MSGFVNTKQVAEHFGCDPRDVAHWCLAGRIKALPRTAPRQPWRIPAGEVQRLEREGLPPSRRTLNRHN